MNDYELYCKLVLVFLSKLNIPTSHMEDYQVGNLAVLADKYATTFLNKINERTKAKPTNEEIVRNSNCWKKLKELAGYVGNGSDTTVVLFQDDATGSYWIKIDNISNYGKSFEEALNKFTEENK